MPDPGTLPARGSARWSWAPASRLRAGGRTPPGASRAFSELGQRCSRRLWPDHASAVLRSAGLPRRLRPHVWWRSRIRNPQAVLTGRTRHVEDVVPYDLAGTVFICGLASVHHRYLWFRVKSSASPHAAGALPALISAACDNPAATKLYSGQIFRSSIAYTASRPMPNRRAISGTVMRPDLACLHAELASVLDMVHFAAVTFSGKNRRRFHPHSRPWLFVPGPLVLRLGLRSETVSRGPNRVPPPCGSA